MLPHVQFDVYRYPRHFLPRFFPARRFLTCASARASSSSDAEFGNFFCWASWGFGSPFIQPEVLLNVRTVCWIFSCFILFCINSKASTFSLWRTSGRYFQEELSHTCKYLKWAVIFTLVTSTECIENQMTNYLVPTKSKNSIQLRQICI